MKEMSSNLTFVPFSMEKTKSTPSLDTIQFVDQSKHYSNSQYQQQQHVKTSPIHASSNMSSHKTLPASMMVGSPILVHVPNMPNHDYRRASVCSLSASVASNSSSSDKSTDSSTSSNTKNKQTLESQIFQFKVHEKEQPKLVFFNFVTKEQIEKKRKYVRKKPVTAVQTIIEESNPLCGKRKHVNVESTNNDSNTTSNSSLCTIPTITSTTNLTNPPPVPSFLPSKRRTSISIAELLN